MASPSGHVVGVHLFWIVVLRLGRLWGALTQAGPENSPAFTIGNMRLGMVLFSLLAG
jgi:hypothetical protein